MERLPLSLQGEERTLGDNQSTLGIVINLWDDPIMISQGLPGNLQGLTTGLVTMTEKERGACNNQHMELGRPSSYLQRSSSNHNQCLCSFAELIWGCTLSRELGGKHVCLIHILKQGVYWP